MAISRKLTCMVICFFSIQVAFPYFDAAALEADVLQIINFVDVLYKHDTQEAKRAAEWLQESIKSDVRDSFLGTIDIIEIAKIITANDTPIDTKLTIINKKMVAQEKIKAARKKELLVSMLVMVACMGSIPALMYYYTPEERGRWGMFNGLDERMEKTILECMRVQKDQTQTK